MTRSVGEPPPIGRDGQDAARATARAVVHARYGSALADKATDRFCLATARWSQLAGSLPLGITESNMLMYSPGRLNLGLTPTVLSFTLDGHAEALASGPGRREVITALRESAYRAMQPAYDEIERLSTRFLSLSFSPEPLGAEPFAPSGPTVLVNQICWLNRTIRTHSPVNTLAEVAADPAIRVIDVPHPLVADTATSSVQVISTSGGGGGTAAAGASTSVGVIDGEVAGNHPALARRVVHRRNFTREGWGNPSAHATAVAGIIAADDANDAGVAPDVTITNYKVLAPGTTQQDFDGYLALQEALNDDLDVVNCSWGIGTSGDGTSDMAVLIDSAWAAGMIVVKSAGNLGPRAGTITAPGDADGLIVVGATDADGLAVTDYSSRGPVGGRPGPHLVAPGGTSTKPLRVAQVGGGFAQSPTAWGTSFAAPHVTGAAALLLARDRTLTPDDVRNRLIANCRLLSSGGPDEQGAGLIHL